jgi:hypothetical protein
MLQDLTSATVQQYTQIVRGGQPEFTDGGADHHELCRLTPTGVTFPTEPASIPAVREDENRQKMVFD